MNCSPDYVETGLCKAHPAGILMLSIGWFLAIVIVLLFTYAECGEDNAIVMGRGYIIWSLTRFHHKTEIVGNDGK